MVEELKMVTTHYSTHKPCGKKLIKWCLFTLPYIPSGSAKRVRCLRLKSMVFGGEWAFLLPLAFMFLLFNLEHSLFLMGKTKTFCNSLFRLGWGFPSRSSNGGTMDFKISPFGLKRSFSFYFTLGVAKAFYTPFPFDKLTDDSKKIRIPFGSGIME